MGKDAYLKTKLLRTKILSAHEEYLKEYSEMHWFWKLWAHDGDQYRIYYYSTIL